MEAGMTFSPLTARPEPTKSSGKRETGNSSKINKTHLINNCIKGSRRKFEDTMALESIFIFRLKYAI